MPSNLQDVYRKAQRHLARRDPVLKRLVTTYGPCTLEPNDNGFLVLVKSIISQMISTRAALSIGAKLEAATGRAGLTPRGILNLGTEKLRGVGLSGAKVAALTDLAERVRSGDLPMARFPQMSDDEVIALLGLARSAT